MSRDRMICQPLALLVVRHNDYERLAEHVPSGDCRCIAYDDAVSVATKRPPWPRRDHRTTALRLVAARALAPVDELTST